MSQMSLTGMKIAILVANGFDQDQCIAMQKALVAAKADARIVSPNNGLVNGWAGDSWGHHFAVDKELSRALGADYDAVVIPGDRRSVEKLAMTAHTKRFLNSFMASGRPVACTGEGAIALAECSLITGREVTGKESCREEMTRMGAVWVEDKISRDGNLLCGRCETADEREAFAGAFLVLLSEMQDREQQAA